MIVLLQLFLKCSIYFSIIDKGIIDLSCLVSAKSRRQKSAC